MTEINDLKKMLKVIKNRLEKRQFILLSTVLKTASRCAGGKIEQEPEREKYRIWVWGGRCPRCDIYNEVDQQDVRFESGLFGTPAGHYCKCLYCGYNDVSIKNREF